MTSITELTKTSRSQLHSTLVEGLNDLDENQEWTFYKYLRKVLPLDGYVFWVKSSLIEEENPSLPSSIKVNGYLHVTTDSIQEDVDIFDKNVVTFTSTSAIDTLNVVSNDFMYIAEYKGLKFAFELRAGYNEPADLYHYTGEALFPRMYTQIIDDLESLDLENVVVSSSLPMWLALDSICPVFPAKLGQQNFAPPFATVTCGTVSPVAGGYHLSFDLTQSQLVSEDVTVTLTGLRNNEAMDFIRMVSEYTLSDDAEFGIMNVPFIQDERDKQDEFNILSMRKVIKFRVNYYQCRVRELSRKLILKAIPQLYRS